MKGEEWRVVDWLPGRKQYEISNFGRLRRRYRSQDGYTYPTGTINDAGYRIYYISNDNKPGSNGHRAHLLVARAFIGPRPRGKEVNHKDTNKLNNHVSNLEYVTHGFNIAHAAENGLCHHGERNPFAKLTWEKVREIRRLRDKKVPRKQVASQFFVCEQTVFLIETGKTWKESRLQNDQKRMAQGKAKFGGVV